MPVPPYTWQVNDWFTASRLNTELYRTFGLPFHPNGTGFHAAKPIYKSWGANPAFGSSGVWAEIGGTSSSFALSFPVVADTGAMFGSRADPIQGGTMKMNVPNSGGAAGVAGGLGLVSGVFPFGANSSGTGLAQAGLGPLAASPSIVGTVQPGNNSFISSPWALDIMDMNGNGPLTGFTNWANVNVLAPVSGSDGSGETWRFAAFWASSYPANGATVSAIPSLRSAYGGSTNLTAALMNSNINQLFTLLNMPPVLRVASTATTSIPSGTATAINLPAVSGAPNFDTYGKWSNATNTYTVPLPGIYLVAGFVPFGNIGNTHTSAALKINSSTYFGPAITAVSGLSSAGGKVGIFDLNQGDTIQLQGFQQSGSSQNAQAGALLTVLFLGAQGASSPLPSVPDPAYSFQAGTPGSQMTSVLNAHLANDLNFLLNKPYFLGYQSTSQLNATEGVSAALSINQVKGIVHGTTGDPWSGWTGSAYAAPVPGWYLAVEEIFAVPPTLANASCQACLGVSPAGSVTPDVYQANNCAAGVSNTGASALGIYYLRAGDTITPMFWENGFFSSGNVGTNVASGINSHFEVCWLGS